MRTCAARTATDIDLGLPRFQRSLQTAVSHPITEILCYQSTSCACWLPESGQSCACIRGSGHALGSASAPLTRVLSASLATGMCAMACTGQLKGLLSSFLRVVSGFPTALFSCRRTAGSWQRSYASLQPLPSAQNPTGAFAWLRHEPTEPASDSFCSR